tara:strand:- start:342 stop:893 length:552 start_codon:yes stop_codon:yes gene_type:complete
MKLFLKALLITHIISLLFVNIISFKQFSKNETKRLNSFGKSFLVDSKIATIPEFIKNTIGLYSNLIGSNRGYEFFSPNVSNGSSKLIFISENGQVIEIVKSIESQVKLLTATYHFNTYIFNEKMKNKILASICSRIFTLNPQINEISVYVKFSKYNELKNSYSKNYNISYEKTLLSTVSRNKN